MKKIRLILFSILILLNCNFFSGYVFAYSAEDDISAAIKLFKFGMFEKSYAILLKALEHSPEHLELNFYLGRAAFELQNYEMAIMAFERILIASPSEPRVKLEMARTFQRLGANNVARQYCNEVLTSNPPEAVKENIRKFLKHIDKTEQKHFLRGMIYTGVDWNNNVWASPSTGKVKTVIGDITLTGPSAKKVQDWVYNTILVMSHTYRGPDSKDSWKTQAIIYNGIYEKTSALDLRLMGLTTGYETKISRDKRIGFSLLANRVELGSEGYLNAKGIKVSLNHIVTPAFLLNTALKYEIKNYPDLPEKDAKNTAILTDMTLLHKKNRYNIGLKAEKEDARNDDYGYARGASNISLTRDLPLNMSGSINYGYQFTQYKEKNLLFNERRKDHQHIAGCTLKKKLWQAKKPDQYMELNLNYQHTWAFSNIELYDYSMDLLQLFLTYNF